MIRSLLMFAVFAVIGMTPAAASAEMPAALDDNELAEQRGGFVMVGGLTFDFAAQLTTFIDGRLALESHLNLSGPSDPSRLVMLPDGTEILHQFDGQSLTNILVNRADNRDLRQDLNVTLTLPGFANVQTHYDAIRLGSDLVGQIRAISGMR